MLQYTQCGDHYSIGKLKLKLHSFWIPPCMYCHPPIFMITASNQVGLSQRLFYGHFVPFSLVVVGCYIGHFGWLAAIYTEVIWLL